jgi:hypothetical protein
MAEEKKVPVPESKVSSPSAGAVSDLLLGPFKETRTYALTAQSEEMKKVRQHLSSVLRGKRSPTSNGDRSVGLDLTAVDSVDIYSLREQRTVDSFEEAFDAALAHRSNHHLLWNELPSALAPAFRGGGKIEVNRELKLTEAYYSPKIRPDKLQYASDAKKICYATLAHIAASAVSATPDPEKQAIHVFEVCARSMDDWKVINENSVAVFGGIADASLFRKRGEQRGSDDHPRLLACHAPVFLFEDPVSAKSSKQKARAKKEKEKEKEEAPAPAPTHKREFVLVPIDSAESRKQPINATKPARDALKKYHEAVEKDMPRKKPVLASITVSELVLDPMKPLAPVPLSGKTTHKKDHLKEWSARVDGSATSAADIVAKTKRGVAGKKVVFPRYTSTALVKGSTQEIKLQGLDNNDSTLQLLFPLVPFPYMRVVRNCAVAVIEAFWDNRGKDQSQQQQVPCLSVVDCDDGERRIGYFCTVSRFIDPMRMLDRHPDTLGPDLNGLYFVQFGRTQVDALCFHALALRVPDAPDSSSSSSSRDLPVTDVAQWRQKLGEIRSALLSGDSAAAAANVIKAAKEALNTAAAAQFRRMGVEWLCLHGMQAQQFANI